MKLVNTVIILIAVVLSSSCNTYNPNRYDIPMPFQLAGEVPYHSNADLFATAPNTATLVVTEENTIIFEQLDVLSNQLNESFKYRLSSDEKVMCVFQRENLLYVVTSIVDELNTTLIEHYFNAVTLQPKKSKIIFTTIPKTNFNVADFKNCDEIEFDTPDSKCFISIPFSKNNIVSNSFLLQKDSIIVTQISNQTNPEKISDILLTYNIHNKSVNKFQFTYTHNDAPLVTDSKRIEKNQNIVYVNDSTLYLYRTYDADNTFPKCVIHKLTTSSSAQIVLNMCTLLYGKGDHIPEAQSSFNVISSAQNTSDILFSITKKFSNKLLYLLKMKLDFNKSSILRLDSINTENIGENFSYNIDGSIRTKFTGIYGDITENLFLLSNKNLIVPVENIYDNYSFIPGNGGGFVFFGVYFAQSAIISLDTNFKINWVNYDDNFKGVIRNLHKNYYTYSQIDTTAKSLKLRTYQTFTINDEYRPSNAICNKEIDMNSGKVLNNDKQLMFNYFYLGFSLRQPPVVSTNNYVFQDKYNHTIYIFRKAKV